MKLPTFLRIWPCLLACGFAVGCGAKGPEATVRGGVTLEGQPLHEGVVTFFSTSGTSGSGELGADGYTLIGPNKLAGVAAGSYTAVVMPSMAQIKKAQSDPQSRVKASAIPTKYTSAATSPLKVEVAPGENRVDLDLDQGTVATGEAQQAN